jgi:hypothetical protein
MYRSKKVKIILYSIYVLLFHNLSMHIGHCEVPVWAFKECNALYINSLAILNDILSPSISKYRSL